MSRIARIVLPGYPHHITQRGVRSQLIFFTDRDRDEYLHLLDRQGRRFGVRFLAYCLMSNHVHLVVVPETERSLSLAIGEAHRLYTRSINARQGVKGYLFQGRFYSCPLDERHFFASIRYIERNPVRAGIVHEAWEYRWSSARYHIELCKEDILVKDSELIVDMHDWKELLRSDPDEVEILREKVRTGRPCGSETFVRNAERLTGRQLFPHLAGRPKKIKL